MRIVGNILLFYIVLAISVSCTNARSKKNSSGIYDKQTTDSIYIVDSIHYDIHTCPDIIKLKACIDYDSITFSDGSSAVYILKFAPQNSLVKYVDSQNRIIALSSRASECNEQNTICRYDSLNRLSDLYRFYSWDIDGGKSYTRFRNNIEKSDFIYKDSLGYEHFSLYYNDKNQIYKVKREPSGDSIIADNNSILEVSLEPCEAFWVSDIRGGLFVFVIKHILIDEDGNRRLINTYKDFIIE